jgi:hypothetical protein
MIRVLILRDDHGHYKGFHIEGHAGYAGYGEDIVCSAVSVLAINTVNAIENFTEDAFTCIPDEETGLIRVDFPEELSHDAQLLVRTMVQGLVSMEESYSDHIHVEIKEV